MLKLETRTRSNDFLLCTIETTRLTQVQSRRFQLLDSFQHLLYTVGRLCKTALPGYRGVCDHHGREFYLCLSEFSRQVSHHMFGIIFTFENLEASLPCFTFGLFHLVNGQIIRPRIHDVRSQMATRVAVVVLR
jgi:hypothetical protein